MGHWRKIDFGEARHWPRAAAALKDWAYSCFLTVEGPHIFVHGENVGDLIMRFDLADTLEWEIQGHMLGDGKIRDKGGQASLLVQRAIYVDLISQIDSALDGVVSRAVKDENSPQGVFAPFRPFRPLAG